MGKPSLPQGTRDFGPEVVRKRNYIISTIKNVFELYGFEPLETPAMENLDTLMGKYGEEGDKLIFKIRSNRNIFNTYPDKKTQLLELLKDVSDVDYSFLPHKGDKALRYDLTIPFARYVSMNYSKLTFPFKRYQIQPVWRGDKPQRGRYREFYQCDADVVGSKSLLNEVELILIYQTAFKKLNVDVSIKINNRKILQGIAEYCGYPNQLIDITVAIDKLDKIGKEGVLEELSKKGINLDKAQKIFSCIDISSENYDKNLCDLCNENFEPNSSISEKKLICLKEKFQGTTQIGIEGIEEILNILKRVENPSLNINNVDFDTSLARGLNYYTGTIFEVKAEHVQIGSIGGGGRYDDLTGLFGVPNVPGVGISFGVDRIYDVLEELKLFPQEVQKGAQVLFFNLGETESRKAFELMQSLRGKGISCELYHEQAKLDKQFKYAERKGIAYAVTIGSRELETGTCNIKNLATREQISVPFEQLEKAVSDQLSALSE